MDHILTLATEEVKKIAATADEPLRRKMIDTLRDLLYMLETPEETMQRLILNLGVFNILSESDGPLSLQDLTARTGADPVLLGRFLRHQASLGYIKETAKDEFTANHTTRNLSVSNIQAGLIFCNDILGPSFQAIPSFLAERKYKNPTELLDTPFHKAWKTVDSMYTWLDKRPRETAVFNQFMHAQRSSVKNCFSFLALYEECRDWSSGRGAVFVDVGGGTGQQCKALREKFPDLPGKVVLQDLPTMVAKAEALEGVEAMAYDFFTPQPIKGAKYYYLRAILHDHADDKCLEILANIADAMTDESTLLIDDIVVPNQNVSWYVTQTDLAMMVQFSATDRTEEQWKELLAKAGLEVQKVTTYTHAWQLSVIAATKAK
ncbi:o-methyltransferas-like protein [Bimuria novae-zelandiae CBS 107.79]|uniref:O-methyltransferas-like protein n=1 Tax=Bimuria novae-zelandiae CBS 107.79 TaxID=1447943 RepID=A0A6A5UPT6_9PLEO|nr:o-methyltransferas-like protein [Bimuria novae-zelandiae CBS 107.79]